MAAVTVTSNVPKRECRLMVIPQMDVSCSHNVQSMDAMDGANVHYTVTWGLMADLGILKLYEILKDYAHGNEKS